MIRPLIHPSSLTRATEIHRHACKLCPSATSEPDPETLDYMAAPRAEQVASVFKCAWRPTKACKGYCAVRLVITGSRYGHPDVERWMFAFAVKHGVPDLTIVGDATGVDDQAWQFAVTHLWSYAFIRVKRALGNPEMFHDRNQRMVNLADKGDWLLAFPDAKSRGTYDCINRGKARGLNVHTAKIRR